MPPKKKSSKKKDEPEVPAAPKYDHPDIKPSRFDDRRVKITCKMSATLCEALELTLEVAPSIRLAQIEQSIVDRHGKSIQNVQMKLHNYKASTPAVDKNSTLADNGVVEGDCTILYDFEPVSGPLLLE
eukprot:GDKH01001374.1.p1 GENE.GDKH01001374.1~~GDKH01001374.1.p1  ORF type:complete len:128 (-),score=16.96 GDKH01001374.1:57-440(-)